METVEVDKKNKEKVERYKKGGKKLRKKVKKELETEKKDGKRRSEEER